MNINKEKYMTHEQEWNFRKAGYGYLGMNKGLSRTEYDMFTFISVNPYTTKATIRKEKLFRNTSLSTINRGVDKLVEKGLVVKYQDKEDKRNVCLLVK